MHKTAFLLLRKSHQTFLYYLESEDLLKQEKKMRMSFGGFFGCFVFFFLNNICFQRNITKASVFG